MRILHVTGSVDPRSGGPIEGILRQAEEHERQGAKVEILSLDPPDAPYLSGLPVRVHAMGVRAAWYREAKRYVPWLKYGYTPHFTPWLRDNMALYDAIFVNGLWNYSSLGAWRSLRKSSIPYFVFTHGMLDPWFRTTYPIKHLAKQLLWVLAEGHLLSGASYALFTCEEERVRASGVFFGPRYRERVVAYGAADASGDPSAQIEAFHLSSGHPKGRRFLLFLGRLHPKKGCDLLVEALARVSSSHLDVDIVMAGPDELGWAPELKAKARALGVGDRILWPGMLTGDAKWGALRAADALILPSHQENFGVVVAEAMACGRPTLITDKVNIWREVEAMGGGFVGPDTMEGVVGLLARFLALDGEVRREMGCRARRTYETHFDIRHTVKEISELVAQASGAPV